MVIKILDNDIIKVYKFGKPRKKENLIATLFWGDNIDVIQETASYKKVELKHKKYNPTTGKYEWITDIGALPANAKFRSSSVLKIRFVDVGQGDATIIESPGGKIILLDGGEMDHLRYYIEKAWENEIANQTLSIETIVVTHGDADHFSGLSKLLEERRYPSGPMVSPDLIYHNGLVKAPSSYGDALLLGPYVYHNNKKYATELFNDLRVVPDSRLNRPFKRWKKALVAATVDNPNLKMQRIKYGDQNVFTSFKNEGIDIQVLGPIEETINGSAALPFLHKENSSSYSTSHTINGHSVVLRLVYGNVRFLLGADLNAESEAGLLERSRADNLSLASEILKVPHHGSADFAPSMLEAIRPTVSVVSSGDESESKEYIHPRAGLIGALGKYSNPSIEKPLVYVTEMVAFFKRIGWAKIHELSEKFEIEEEYTISNAYNKISFGIVHVRTNGERVLVATHSGKPGDKEEYVFKVDTQGNIEFEEPSIL